jgi:hypothetical protein
MLWPIPFPGMVVRLSSYLFSSVLRRHYTKAKLSGLLEIKVSNVPAGLTVICSELPSATAWIEITNLSPFHVTIHEVEADFYLPDRVAKFVKICNTNIRHGATERLFMETDLTGKQVNYIRKHKQVQTAGLKINGLVSCKLSSFEIIDRTITVNNIEFRYCNDR